MNDPEESTTITFDVTYDTGINSIDRWLDVQPFLFTLIIIVGVIIIVVFIARKSQKKAKTKPESKVSPKAKAEATLTAEPTTQPTKKQPETWLKCVRCESKLREDSQYCPNCGTKVEGRKLGESGIITPLDSKVCSYCGSKVTPGTNFCKYCGTPIAN